jgi:hypothetical protein
MSRKTVEPAVDECVRRKDSDAKYNMKTHADLRNRAMDKGITVGDTVLMKNDFKGDKMSSMYNP